MFDWKLTWRLANAIIVSVCVALLVGLLGLFTPVHAQIRIPAPPTAPGFAMTEALQATSACGAGSATVDVNKPFKVCFTHDGVGTTHEVVILTRPSPSSPLTQTVTKTVSQVTGGEYVFDFTAQSVIGAYSVKACARNVDPADANNYGEKCADVVSFRVDKPIMVPPPTAPSGIRIGGLLSVAGGPPQPAVFTVASVETVK